MYTYTCLFSWSCIQIKSTGIVFHIWIERCRFVLLIIRPATPKMPKIKEPFPASSFPLGPASINKTRLSKNAIQQYGIVFLLRIIYKKSAGDGRMFCFFYN